MKNTILVSSIIIALGVSSTAGAQTSSSNFNASTSVQSECKIAVLSDLSFHSLDGLSEQRIGIGDEMSIQCTGGTTNVAVAVDEGANPDVSSSCLAPKRQMKSEFGNYLKYELTYTSAEDGWGEKLWGCDASNQKRIAAFVSSGTPVSIFRTATVIERQNLYVGSYVDTLNLTVTF